MTKETNEVTMEGFTLQEGGHVEAFTFGGAEGVLDGPRFLQHAECWSNGKWYEPKVNPRNLSKTMNASPHHRSAIALKKNLLVRHFIDHRLLSVEEFEKWALDFLVQANGYMERVVGMTGRTVQLRHSLAQNTRRGIEEGQYFFLNPKTQPHEFANGSIFHMREYDTGQEIYGLPEYLAALQSALLNEAATLFRRRYYINGAHAGFIMYVSEAGLHKKDAETIKEAMKKAKGIGNFKNLFLHVPGGKEKGVQILPISEVAAKDEFQGVKNITRDDVLAVWRIPPQLMGVVPANAGGFGDIEKAEAVFFRNEIAPLQRRFQALNNWLGEEVVRFTPYEPVASGGSGGRGGDAP